MRVLLVGTLPDAIDRTEAVLRCAAGAPLPEHGAVATETARDLLATQRVAGEGTTAVVRRSGNRLVVTLGLAPDAEPHAAAITVKILTALRSLDPYADGIDVVRG